MNIDQNRLYSKNEVCEILQVSGNTLIKLLKRGEMRFVQIVGQKKFTGQMIMDFLNAAEKDVHVPQRRPVKGDNLKPGKRAKATAQ